MYKYFSEVVNASTAVAIYFRGGLKVYNPAQRWVDYGEKKEMRKN